MAFRKYINLISWLLTLWLREIGPCSSRAGDTPMRPATSPRLQLPLTVHVQFQAGAGLEELDLAKQQDGGHHLEHVHAGDAQDDQVHLPVEPLHFLSLVCPRVAPVE